MSVVERFKAVWRVNRWFPCLCLGLLVTVVVSFVWSNQRVLPKVGHLEQRFMELQEQVRQARRMAATEGSQISIVSQGRDDLKTFRQMVPLRENFEQLIGEIFSLADKVGLDISSISYGQGNVDGLNLQSYKLSFDVSGGYRQLKQFLSLIESSERLIVVDSISLSGRGEKDVVSLKLTLTTFFRMGKA
ncbi:MAG: hypothetical protein C0616_05840 [Desulfuromonas sp.]|nr:MAG: hypothetical protein C0616_05840 [Desulfuromonas sp.]